MLSLVVVGMGGAAAGYTLRRLEEAAEAAAASRRAERAARLHTADWGAEERPGTVPERTRSDYPPGVYSEATDSSQLGADSDGECLWIPTAEERAQGLGTRQLNPAAWAVPSPAHRRAYKPPMGPARPALVREGGRLGADTLLSAFALDEEEQGGLREELRRRRLRRRTEAQRRSAAKRERQAERRRRGQSAAPPPLPLPLIPTFSQLHSAHPTQS